MLVRLILYARFFDIARSYYSTAPIDVILLTICMQWRPSMPILDCAVTDNQTKIASFSPNRDQNVDPGRNENNMSSEYRVLRITTFRC